MAEETAGAAGAVTEGGEGAGEGFQVNGAREGSLLSAGQNGSVLDWRFDLPENQRNAPIIQRLDTKAKAVQTLMEQEKMISRSVGHLPDEGATPEEVAAARRRILGKLGMPKEALEYTIPHPEEHELDPETASRWQRTLHEAGLSQEQVDIVVNGLIWQTAERGQKMVEGQEVQSEADGRRALYAEFGASTEQMLGRARGFFEFMAAGAYNGREGGEKAKEVIMEARLKDGSLLANNPYFVAAFAEAASKIGEAEWYDSEQYVPGQNTLERTQARHKELTAKRHQPGGLTQEETTELFRLANSLSAPAVQSGRLLR